MQETKHYTLQSGYSSQHIKRLQAYRGIPSEEEAGDVITDYCISCKQNLPVL